MKMRTLCASSNDIYENIKFQSFLYVLCAFHRTTGISYSFVDATRSQRTRSWVNISQTLAHFFTLRQFHLIFAVNTNCIFAFKRRTFCTMNQMSNSCRSLCVIVIKHQLMWAKGCYCMLTCVCVYALFAYKHFILSLNHERHKKCK